MYTCAKCGKKFTRLGDLTRHARIACTDDDDDITKPPSPKRSIREDTTPHHPLVTDADPIDPPARLPFADNLSTELLDVVRAHWSTIRTRVTRGPLQCRYDYRLTTLDTTVLETPLKNVFQEQTNAFKINLSYGFILRNKNTGQYKYYHPSCNCCGRYLDEPVSSPTARTLISSSNASEKPTSCNGPSIKDRIRRGVVRTRDQCHIFRQSHHRSPDRMCRNDPTFQCTSRRTKPSSDWKRSPSMPRGTVTTCFSSDVCPASRM